MFILSWGPQMIDGNVLCSQAT
uniref:Uncharacterized protein n=1 Tax=Anguilla anguilla TaxID=7936 RepID=A0A0E9TCP1_ANGAN